MHLERDGPNDDNENRNSDFHQRSERVRTAIVEEHVMKVRLIGLKGGIALHDAAEHDT